MRTDSHLKVQLAIGTHESKARETVKETLTFEKNGTEYMKLCLDVTLYWTGSVFDNVKGVLNFYNRAIEIIGTNLTFYVTETMSDPKPVTSDTLALLPNWLLQPDRSRDILNLTLESSPGLDLISDRALDFWAVEYPETPAGMIRLVLPTNFIEKTPTVLVDLAKELAQEMKFHSGHGGYAINWDHKGHLAFPARREMSVLSRRYPAIELPEVAATLMAIPSGLKRINWLTFVGNVLFQPKENLGSLKAKLGGNGIAIEQLQGGVLVVAGDEPRLGDVNRQENLAAYHRVGSALAALRSRDHSPFLINRMKIPDDELTEEWLAYFDQ